MIGGFVIKYTIEKMSPWGEKGVCFYSKNHTRTNLQNFWFDDNTFKIKVIGTLNYNNEDNARVYVARQRLGINNSSERL